MKYVPKIKIGAETYDVKDPNSYKWLESIMLNGSIDIFQPYKYSHMESIGLTCDLQDDGYYVINGVAEQSGVINISVIDPIPEVYKGIGKITVNCDANSNDFSNVPYLQIYKKLGSETSYSLLYAKGLNASGLNRVDTVEIPSNITAFLARIAVTVGTVFNNYRLKVSFLAVGSENIMVTNRILPNGTDANSIPEKNTLYLIDGSSSYSNLPIGVSTGWLFDFDSVTTKLQACVPFSCTKMFLRRAFKGLPNSWTDWCEIGSGGGTQNIFNNYENTYNVTSSPTIRTDSNQYLASTNDATDRTNDIATMLSEAKVCRLGPGKFYVNNLVMPDNSSLIGSGAGTELILSGTADGFAVKMGSYCTVKNLKVIGSEASITLSDTVGGRHGILWQGTYTHDQSAPEYGIISDVFIKGFTGGGITCQDTGFGTSTFVSVTNADIMECNAGINVYYWSEFNKFTNVRARSCYYGCINNGGNNVFVNCDFSSDKLAFLMDNANNQSPNNSHGSAVGCVFNHTDNNTGIGIKVLNCDHGFIFTGCQIFFSQIDIQNSDGVVVSDTNFGDNNCNISITGGGAILFANNLHQAKPTITITNNAKVHFANCYVRSTGDVVSN